jgi:hypothetical protein
MLLTQTLDFGLKRVCRVGRSLHNAQSTTRANPGQACGGDGPNAPSGRDRASGVIPEHWSRRVLRVVVAQERVKLLRIHPLNLLLKLTAVMPIVRIGTRVRSRTG